MIKYRDQLNDNTEQVLLTSDFQIESTAAFRLKLGEVIINFTNDPLATIYHLDHEFFNLSVKDLLVIIQSIHNILENVDFEYFDQNLEGVTDETIKVFSLIENIRNCNFSDEHLIIFSFYLNKVLLTKYHNYSSYVATFDSEKEGEPGVIWKKQEEIINNLI